jgi:GNAT superfamily N-acetyltransferase
MPSFIHIREIDPASESEIGLVAQRMRDTLVEVEGEETGTALYSMQWLRDRVRWHLEEGVVAKVLLAIDASGEIVGHTIVRREVDEKGEPFGLVSTTYVVPDARRSGVAEELLRAGEKWMQDLSLGSSSTWTSLTNTKLIALYEKHGYAQKEVHTHATTGTRMVRLERRLSEVIG